MAHGYAHLLVDLRGLGNSAGVAWETLDPREAGDAAEIVEWAARQAWCDGNVGMWGLSYGGVTALHAAFRRPPHLKTIVPIQCPVDLFHELLCRLACLPYYGNWGTWMVGMNLMPPGYQDAQGRWEEVWKERLESGKVYRFRIPLCNASYLVAKGHRLRLSVSCADFPRLWPTQTNPEIRLFFGGSHDSTLRLPVVPPAADPVPEPEIRRPDPAVNSAPLTLDVVSRWKIEQDLIAGKLAVTTGSRQQMLIPSGGKMLMDTTITASVSADRPDGAKLEGEGVIQLELPATGLVEVESQTLLTRTRVLLAGKVTVNGRLFFEKRWQR